MDGRAPNGPYGIKKVFAEVNWASNPPPASALSYRQAQTKDAAATALEMGNSPTVLLRDYRERVGPVSPANERK